MSMNTIQRLRDAASGFTSDTDRQATILDFLDTVAPLFADPAPAIPAPSAAPVVMPDADETALEVAEPETVQEPKDVEKEPEAPESEGEENG